MENKEYFIFGEAPAREYYALDWNEFKKLFKQKMQVWDFQLYDFDWSLETGEDLLKNYEGYRGFAKITYEEYKELDKIRNGIL